MSARFLLLTLLVMAGCSKGSQADLQSIGQARSAAYEWALVNEQAGQGKLTPTYVSAMHAWLRDALHTSLTGLTQPDSRYGRDIATLLQQPDDAAPAVLRARAADLKAIEDSLESA